MPDSTLPDLDLRLGIAMKRQRKHLGLNQKELAEKVGVTQAFISQVEKGRRGSRININTLQAMAIGLGWERLSDLIRAAEDVPPLEQALDNARALVASLQA